jgi:DnaD/phage-associated family protein
MRFTPLPNIFFTALLPKIDSVTELKLVLHIFWLLYQKRSHPKFVTYNELLADKTLITGIEGDDPAAELMDALEQAVARGIFFKLTLEKDDEQEELYFVNDESNRQAIDRVKSGELSLGAMLPRGEAYIKVEKPDIFTLYEQNIGMLTPMIAEELKEAERLYPAAWIEDAVKEAVNLNKRNWRYIARILENWSLEGREDGKSRRNLKKEKGPGYYLKGKYGHIVKH